MVTVQYIIVTISGLRKSHCSQAARTCRRRCARRVKVGCAHSQGQRKCTELAGWTLAPA